MFPQRDVHMYHHVDPGADAGAARARSRRGGHIGVEDARHQPQEDPE